MMTVSHGARVLVLVALTGLLGLSAAHAAPGNEYCRQFWPAGLVTVILLLVARRLRLCAAAVLGLVATATFVVGGQVSLPLGVALGASVLVEAVTVSYLLGRNVPADERFSLLSNSDLLRFVLATLAGSLLAGSMMGVASWVQGLADPAYVGIATFAARLVSELLIVPFVARMPRTRGLAGRPERVLQWSVAVLTTAVLLLPVGLVITALAMIPLLGWGALRLPARAAMLQTIIVSVVVAGTTQSGVGSFSRLPGLLGLPESLRNTLAAVFIIDCIFVVLPLALAVSQQVGTARLAAAERDKLENIVDSATGVAIIGADANGMVTLFNPGAERMLGWSAAEVLGRSTRMFHSQAAIAVKAHELGVDATFSTVARLLAGPGHAGTDMGFLRKDGAERVHSMTLTPLVGDDGRALGFVSTSEDVTERVNAAVLLQEALDAEREAVERLQEVDAVKDAFVSMVSHELRTPITSILGYVEMLEDGSYGGLTSDQSAAVTRVATNSSRLLSLIDDLLTLSRVQQNGIGMSTRAFDLRSVVMSAHDLVAPTWRTRQLQVSLVVPDEPVDFLGDKDMLERVVVNLLGNAVKFTPAGGTISVRLTVETDEAVIAVSDTGIGVPESEHGRLFQRFFRASTAQQQHIPGTGLGLSITKAIVEQHSGSIQVLSNRGPGTTFEVRMPLPSAGAVRTHDPSEMSSFQLLA